jgi:hypothetical protein
MSTPDPPRLLSNLERAHQHLQAYERIMSTERVNIDALRQWAFYGVPERLSRAIVWKLLWGYLPPRRADWAASQARSRKNYRSFVSELTINPYQAVEVCSGCWVH